MKSRLPLSLPLAVLFLLTTPAAFTTRLIAEENASIAATEEVETGFQSIFDGTLEGWKKSTDNPESWQVVDGMLVCEGERCHLFYEGPLAPMKNFHFKAEVMTTPGSNAGIYFHTKYQEKGWPKYGYECQVNVSHKDVKKSSSLYAVENVDAADLQEAGIEDNVWYTQEILVRGKHIVLKINGKTMVDFTEPEEQNAFSDQFDRRLGEGTIALQAHDPKSKVFFRDLRLKKLDD